MSRSAITRDTLSGEALFILKSLRDNGRLGRSNKLAEVKSALEPAVSLDFDSYFFFLRKFHYIAMDREAQLKLTETGEKVVEGDRLDKFTSEVGRFFSNELSGDEKTTMTHEETASGEAAPAASALATPAPAERTEKAERAERARATGATRVVETLEVKAPAPPAAPASLSDLRYVKGESLGQGPIGVVYKGRQSALAADVCLKELKDLFGYFSFLQRTEVLRRLRKELCSQAQVRHPGVMSVLDQSTEAGRPFYVLELMAGSLKDRLAEKSGAGLEPNAALRWFLQMVYGLRAAHRNGLTHHNLKPENVLFDRFGNARLSDFGLSRIVEVDSVQGMPQVFVGTGGMAYLAPELLQKSKDAGPAADVYALGILLYQMLTGQIPGRRSPMPSEVCTDAPKALDAIFDKMTQDPAASRYPDLDALLDDFYAAFPNAEHGRKGELILSSEEGGAADAAAGVGHGS